MKDNEFNNIKLLVRLRSNVDAKLEKPPKDEDQKKTGNTNDRPANSTNNNRPPKTDPKKPKPQVVISKYF